MAGPDLTAARRAAEGFLDDRVTVVRDADRVPGAFDEVTGAYAPDADDAALWSGPALVSRETDLSEAGGPLVAVDDAAADPGRYRLLLPLAAPALREGDTVLVTASRRDVQLRGRRLRVSGPPVLGTYEVLRRVPATLEPV